MILQILLSMMIVLSLAGCATMKKNTAGTQELEMRVSDLEKRLQEKNDEIRILERKLGRTTKTSQETSQAKIDVSKVTKRQIQTALANAGFYNGPIDGKVGHLTTEAIKEFQKANNLKEDGVVGQQTWAKLNEHLE